MKHEIGSNFNIKVKTNIYRNQKEIRSRIRHRNSIQNQTRNRNQHQKPSQNVHRTLNPNQHEIISETFQAGGIFSLSLTTFVRRTSI